MTFLFLGLLFGFLSATVTESLGHRFTGHPGPRQRRLYLKYPRLFHIFLKPYYQHLVIHHHRTFKGNFFDQFRDELEKKELDTWISRKFSKQFSELIWVERYNLTLKGISGTLPFAIPFTAGPLLIGMVFGWTAFFASLLTAFIPVWMSKFIHPLVHLPEETHLAHPLIQWLMKTSYMKMVFKNHYLHHQQLETNFNLLLGGDYIVGHHRAPTIEEAVALESLLPEFERRVRYQPENAQAPADVALTCADSAQDSILKLDAAYLALGRPTFEQRFSSQLKRAEAFQAALAEAKGPVLEKLHEARKTFSMRYCDKGIRVSEWSKQAEFSLQSYQFDGQRVTYRGTQFESGDVLLTNQSSDSDGLFSTLLAGEINFSHAALFILLDFDGQKYPAVIEMNEDGIRAVPLKALLSAQFNSYVEIFRSRSPLSSEEKTSLENSAAQMLEEDHAFDIFQDAEQTKYLNCARTISEIFLRAGLIAIPGASYYHSRTFKNLKTLGIFSSANKFFLMPDDYARSDRFYLIGLIDNAQFHQMLARHLMRSRIQEIWRQNLLAPSQFPLEYKLNKFVISSVQKNTWFSGLLLRFLRIDRARFPSGPVTFMSLITLGNRFMESGTRKILKKLLEKPARFQNLQSWQALRYDKAVVDLLNQASMDFSSLYKLTEDSLDSRVSLGEKIDLPKAMQKSI
jgi:hypothetical protein